MLCFSTHTLAYGLSSMASSKASLTVLKQLAALITSELCIIENVCIEKGLHFPSLDDTAEDALKREDTKKVPEIAQAILTIVAAASQLSATLQPVETFVLTAAHQVSLV